jgi:hypothetical protein
MSPYSAEFIKGLCDERTIVTQRIVDLQSGATGHSFTPSQRTAAIDQLQETAAQIEELINEFSRYENPLIICELVHTDASR